MLFSSNAKTASLLKVAVKISGHCAAAKILVNPPIACPPIKSFSHQTIEFSDPRPSPNKKSFYLISYPNAMHVSTLTYCLLACPG